VPRGTPGLLHEPEKTSSGAYRVRRIFRGLVYCVKPGPPPGRTTYERHLREGRSGGVAPLHGKKMAHPRRLLASSTTGTRHLRENRNQGTGKANMARTTSSGFGLSFRATSEQEGFATGALRGVLDRRWPGHFPRQSLTTRETGAKLFARRSKARLFPRREGGNGLLSGGVRRGEVLPSEGRTLRRRCRSAKASARTRADVDMLPDPAMFEASRR